MLEKDVRAAKFKILIFGVAAIVLAVCFHSIFRGRTSHVRPGVTHLTWKILALMDPDTGEAPPIVTKLNSAEVQIAGYMVPLDDNAKKVREFLLVPYEGACIHVPPPPANQMIYVKLENEPVGYEPGAILTTGKMSLVATQSPYGKVTYALAAESVEKFVANDSEKKRSGLDF